MRKTLIFLGVALFSVLLPLSAKTDEVRYIANSHDAIAATITAIQSAEKSIDFVYFIFEPCHPSARVVYDLLLKKARQGVKVRVLLDAFLYSKEHRAQMAMDFKEAGGEFKVFNPRFAINPLNNYRLHVKLLLVDGKSYITGGRNVADEYFGFAQGFNFIDRDLWITGRSAKQAERSFEELWNSKISREPKLAGFENSSWVGICQKELGKPIDKNWNTKVTRFVLSTANSRSTAMRSHHCKNVRFVSDNPLFMNYGRKDHFPESDDRQPNNQIMTGEKLQQKRTTLEFLRFIDGTKKRLELENWSYMPLEQINKSLKNLRKRDVPILVITNMDADNSGPIKYAEDYLNHRFAKRDTKGSQIVIQMSSEGHLDDSHKLTPSYSRFRLHQKSGIRDGRDVMVGSYNIDPRSYHTNIESIVFVENCTSLAQEFVDRSSDLVRVYNKDVKDGYVSPPQWAPGTLLFAFFGFHFL